MLIFINYLVNKINRFLLFTCYLYSCFIFLPWCLVFSQIASKVSVWQTDFVVVDLCYFLIIYFIDLLFKCLTSSLGSFLTIFMYDIHLGCMSWKVALRVFYGVGLGYLLILTYSFCLGHLARLVFVPWVPYSLHCHITLNIS